MADMMQSVPASFAVPWCKVSLVPRLSLLFGERACRMRLPIAMRCTRVHDDIIINDDDVIMCSSKRCFYMNS